MKSRDNYNYNNLDENIDILIKQYNEIKKDRTKSERDEEILSNRKKLLNNEEIKVARRQIIESKNQEHLEKIRVNVLKDKIKLNETKKKEKEELIRKRNKIYQMKNQIQVTLGSWRENISNKNKNEGIKTKLERDRLEDIYNRNKTDIKEKHKELHDKIQLNHFKNEEKRKNEEIQKKIKLIKDIEEKIKQEKKIKSELDERINNYQQDNLEIIERINNYNKINKSNTYGIFSPIKNSNFKRSTSALIKKDDDPVKRKLLI